MPHTRIQIMTLAASGRPAILLVPNIASVTFMPLRLPLERKYYLQREEAGVAPQTRLSAFERTIVCGLALKETRNQASNDFSRKSRKA